MIYPNKKLEKNLLKQGYQLIAGLDEAGRGAWAGPIVAAAVILPQKSKIPFGTARLVVTRRNQGRQNPKLKIKIKDSKLLTARQRQIAYDWLTKKSISWSVGIISQNIIDQIGLAKANILAFKEAVAKLETTPDFLLIDGIKFNYGKIPSQSVIDGDYKVLSIAAASIIAKVTRDGILKRYHKKYPVYRFDLHKGYGTRKHFQMICKYGICHLHRKSYRPIKTFFDC